MLTINASVKMLYVQFTFSNENAVPQWLFLKEEETPAEAKARKERQMHATGECVIKLTSECSLETLPNDIKDAGFTLVDGYYQPRIDQNNPKKKYYIARYVFIRNEDVVHDELGELREKILAELQDLFLLAFWRVRAFQNPYFKDKEPVDGLSAASVNLEARKPRFHPNGKMIEVWRKDADGNRVGDKKVPLSAGHSLRIQDNTLQLTPL